ncbi:MAG: protein translocase subunit SecD [Anaerolineae bacterium]
MSQRNIVLLIVIILLTAFALWVVLPNNPGIHLKIGSWRFDRDIYIHLGLDLRGGTQLLLEADLPAGESVTTDAMEAAKTIVENRVNALGVTEPLVQLQGDRRIIVQLPGIENPDAAIQTLRSTGLLEFVDTGDLSLPEGTRIRTTYSTASEESGQPTPTATEAAPEASPTPASVTDQVFTTIMTGRHLKSARVGTDEYGRPEIDFELTDEGAQIMADVSRKNVGKFLTIAMDKVVISSPRIETPITEGRGRITSQQGFKLEEAQRLAIQLRYGALPVPLKVVETRSVGPTLGQDSVQRSLRAGIIGLIVVLLFMLSYYRLLGSVSDTSLLIYALLNLAIYQLVPVTLTLPGITGFLLSTGMAVDANILIFERMKEELRAGRPLHSAIEAGFARAWTSIRDSNISTLLTCVILYWFGSNFGASMVKGFAVTLFIGVLISMFTAITVTRTLIITLFALTGEKLREKKWLLGA